MMSTGDAAQAIGGRVYGAPTRFTSVSTDSRAIEAGALFVALRGERFDGHEFIAGAKARGAAAAMVNQAWRLETPEPGIPCIAVEDTRLALGRLAGCWRARFSIPLVAVAGSNGKTTVKEMIAAILRAHYGEEATLATQGNLNNDIGLPLTLLRLRATHRAAVIEVGMNHPGETAYLAGIARPTVALVNNAQREHQEFMKGVEEVAREHGAVFAALPADGTAVINADDPYAAYWRSLVRREQIRDFGIEQPAAVSGRCTLSDFGSEIELSAPEGSVKFTLQVAGLHSALNAVGAAAGATAAGADLSMVAKGLSGFTAVGGRLQVKRGRSGAVIVDDTYNANPDSARAAIEVLSRLPGRRILVLGDMGEVGEQGETFHRETGRCAAQAGIDELLAIGDLAAHAFAEFGSGGTWYAQIEGLLDEVAEKAVAGTTILVKGSRFMRMERVVAALVEEAQS
ncbi:MAG: UDP-N-acetylmuramoyl-tripeptide--D-alanyl-D-alanine ligase [Betaproteobacteria bacterium RIFCSPLOWO2_12_FULL_65_110]|nr:MAG: UDP-N-acetylmuramoyl-tripeptide--D-alanyl-D-alanine ligase [Betaproteobacteria bacterium RIFCSPLOWO2_12_FULL_65_110]